MTAWSSIGAKGFFSPPIENVVFLMCSMCCFGVAIVALANRKEKTTRNQKRKTRSWVVTVLQREESRGFEGNKERSKRGEGSE